MPKNPRFPPKSQASASRRSSPRTVEILAVPAVQLLDVAGPLQVFATANELAAVRGDLPLYAVRVVSSAAPTVIASAGLGLSAAPLPRAVGKLDTLVVAGGPGVHAASKDPVVLNWLHRRGDGAPCRFGLHRRVSPWRSRLAGRAAGGDALDALRRARPPLSGDPR
jgi:transcriptional regulator GlxA family with amidase domain